MCKCIHKLLSSDYIICAAVLFIVCYDVLNYIALLCDFPDSYVKMFIYLRKFPESQHK